MMIPEPSAFKTLLGAVAHLIWMPMYLMARCITWEEPSEEPRRSDDSPIGLLTSICSCLVVLFLFYGVFAPRFVSHLGGQVELFPVMIQWAYAIFHEWLGLPGTLMLFLTVTRKSCLAVSREWKNPACSKELFDGLEVVAVLTTGMLLAIGLGSLMLPLFHVCKTLG